jgi:predicted amidohydrolase
MMELIVTFSNFSNAFKKHLSDLYAYHQYWVAEVNRIIFHEDVGRGGIEAYFYPSLISAADDEGGRHALAICTGNETLFSNLQKIGRT